MPKPRNWNRLTIWERMQILRNRIAFDASRGYGSRPAVIRELARLTERTRHEFHAPRPTTPPR